jgi:heme-degrading monooxygenase HmoA
LPPPGNVLDAAIESRRGSGRKEEAMYAAIRRYHTDPDSIDEVARRVNEEFVDMISDMPGFVAYFVLNAGQGEIGSVSVFEDQESAEESNSRAEEWVRQNLSDLLPTPPDFAAGEVVAYRAK